MWLAISCPDIMLDALALTHISSPSICAERHGNKVIAANTAAQQQGIRVGVSLSQAFTLCPELSIYEPCSKSMSQTLETLAQALGECSATLVLRTPDAVLLEVASMVQYFASWYALFHKAHKIAEQYVSFPKMAWAPTPSLAQWRAQAGADFEIDWLDPALKNTCVHRGIDQWIKDLPIAASRCHTKQLERLQGLGLTTVDGVAKLPNAALRKHLGESLYDQLAKALGLLREPLTPYQPPDTFERTQEFEREIEYSLGLLFPLKNIIQALCVFLTRRRWKLQELIITLTPAWSLDRQTSLIELRIGHEIGTDDPLLWLELIELKLNRLLLDAPIRSIKVETGRCESSTEESGDLFDYHRTKQADIGVFISRLQARLGDKGITAAHVTGDHLPEQFAHFENINMSALSKITHNHSDSQPQPRRPHWLLDPATEIDPTNLVFEQGPERITTAWWQEEGMLQRRDYYQARWPDGRLAWIYRDDHKRWYLHGWFA